MGMGMGTENLGGQMADSQRQESGWWMLLQMLPARAYDALGTRLYTSINAVRRP